MRTTAIAIASAARTRAIMRGARWKLRCTAGVGASRRAAAWIIDDLSAIARTGSCRCFAFSVSE
jgi:hypothetical protein